MRAITYRVLFSLLFVVGLCLSGASDVNASVAPVQGNWTINASGTVTSILPTEFEGPGAWAYFGMVKSLVKSSLVNTDACLGGSTFVSGSSGGTTTPSNQFGGMNVFEAGIGHSGGGGADCTGAGTYYAMFTNSPAVSNEYTAYLYWEVYFDGVTVTPVNPGIVPETNQLFQYSTRFDPDCSYLDGNELYVCTNIVAEDLDESLPERWPTGIYVELSPLGFNGNVAFARYSEALDESCDGMGCVGTSTTNLNLTQMVGTSSPNTSIHVRVWFYNDDFPSIRPFPRAFADMQVVYDENGEIEEVTLLHFPVTATGTVMDPRPFVPCGWGSGTELFGCLQNFFVWVFWPSEITYDSATQLKESLQSEFPFSYVYGTFVGVATLEVSTSTPPDVGFNLWGGATSTLFSATALEFLPEEQWTDIKTLMSVALWFFLFFFFFVRYSKVF